jgi:hypothetical protein
VIVRVVDISGIVDHHCLNFDIMATQILFSMASLLSFHILHRVEFIKSVIYGIVKQMILMIQTL